VVTKTDKFTGKTSTEVEEPYLIGKDGERNIYISATWEKGRTDRFLYVICPDIGCADGNSSVIFILDDNSKIEISSSLEFNCDGFIGINLRLRTIGQPPNKVLWDKRIVALRMKGRTSTAEIELDEETSTEIQRLLRCFNEESAKM